MVHSIPELKVDGDEKGELLVVGWGGTYGSLLTAQNQCFDSERRVSLAHFQYLNPLPKNTEEVFSRFKKIVVCELNNGQLAKYLKTRFPQFEYLQYNKIQGLPFTVQELTDRFKEILSEN